MHPSYVVPRVTLIEFEAARQMGLKLMVVLDALKRALDDALTFAMARVLQLGSPWGLSWRGYLTRRAIRDFPYDGLRPPPGAISHTARMPSLATRPSHDLTVGR
jgi:hypothetical protein